MEVQSRLPTGWRTTGLVELTLDDGTTGLGESYLPTFAPQVFVALVETIASVVIGKPANEFAERHREMVTHTGYWSLQGAARHVIGAFESAMIDAIGKQSDLPAFAILRDVPIDAIRLYASGGDSASPSAMATEINQVAELGIKTFKVRARKHEIAKARWITNRSAELGIEIAIDMCQNLTFPGQSIEEAVRFVCEVQSYAPEIAFLEEALGPERASGYPELRRAVSTPIAGGEVVTTAAELIDRMRAGWYDIVQPDVTVIGGMQETLAVFDAAKQTGTNPVVHCWGSAVGMAANYHTAFAGGASLAEWPLPSTPLRTELLTESFSVADGFLSPPTRSGLGVTLTPEIEAKFPFRPDATYRCLVPSLEDSANVDVWN
jgi:L-alanine-DL-glutamate epimerase-like enolase superfamily enzyme